MVLKKFTWPAELTLNLIGGKWKGLILHQLLTGESRRFGELKRLAPGISAKILAKHLKELEYEGLITRMVTGEDKTRILYAPTLRSRSLAPILSAIRQWGEEHLETYGPESGPGELGSADLPGKFQPGGREDVKVEAVGPSARHPNAAAGVAALEPSAMAPSY